MNQMIDLVKMFKDCGVDILSEMKQADCHEDIPPIVADCKKRAIKEFKKKHGNYSQLSSYMKEMWNILESVRYEHPSKALHRHPLKTVRCFHDFNIFGQAREFKICSHIEQ